jgi:hypothetical protein
MVLKLAAGDCILLWRSAELGRLSSDAPEADVDWHIPMPGGKGKGTRGREEMQNFAMGDQSIIFHSTHLENKKRKRQGKRKLPLSLFIEVRFPSSFVSYRSATLL